MHNLYICEKIKQMCKSEKILIKQMLEDCGLARGFVYDLENRSTTTSYDKLIRIADYFDVSLDYLVGRSEWRRA